MRAIKRRAIFELIIASFFWGGGFIGVRFALSSLSPLLLTTLRFYLHCTVLLPILFFPQFRKASFKKHLKLALLPGVSLGIGLIFQTFGLKITTVSNSSFITVLFIVFVPILEKYWLKKKVGFSIWFCIVVALAGALMLSGVEKGAINWGDALTLVCAFCSAIQIVAIEKIAPKIESSYLFNAFQSFWGGTISLLFVPFEPIRESHYSTQALLALFYLAFVSTQLGFMIQVRAQKVLSSSYASMLYLLESPVAAGMAFFIFGERLNTIQFTGAFLIIVAALMTILLTRDEHSSH